MPEGLDNPIDKSDDDGEPLAGMLLATYQCFVFRWNALLLGHHPFLLPVRPPTLL